MAKVKLKVKKQGQKPITFEKGALHKQLGVGEDKKIPEEKMEAARGGEYGELAKKRADFAKNVLVGKK